MIAVPGFEISVSQNVFLAAGRREVDAVLTVAAAGLTAPAAPPAEVILVDCSGSMNQPPMKIEAARRATVAAIDALPDGASFAVVQGTQVAEMVYPAGPQLAPATPAGRAAAARAVRGLAAAGGTRIGSWLQLAGQLLDAHPDGVRHALLLTDGKDEHEQPEELTAVLDRCAGRFDCDPRAIGDGWEPAELKRIAAALHGEPEEVRLDDLAEDFRAMIARATSRVVPDLRLEVRTMEGVRIRFLRQLHPTAADLTSGAVEASPRTVEFATGSWGNEIAEYHLGLDADPGRFDEATPNQVALVRVRPAGGVAAGAAPGPDPVGVFAHWTHDLVRASRMESRLSHYAGQAALREAVNAGCDAFDTGDRQTATAEWGRAVALAHASGNGKVLRRLAELVDVVDPATGEVRLRTDVRTGARKGLELSSEISALSPAGGSASEPALPAPADGPARQCRCGRVAPPGRRFCEACGRPLGGSQ